MKLQVDQCILQSVSTNIDCRKFITSGISYTNVGGLFHEENTETEMAFKYAIARHNMYNNQVKFRTNIQRISRTDAFSASKIGKVSFISKSESRVNIFECFSSQHA